jgi:hypothetical protein
MYQNTLPTNGFCVPRRNRDGSDQLHGLETVSFFHHHGEEIMEEAMKPP